MLETFWVERTERDGRPASGPCSILVVGDFEVMMFDCFGADLGHFHVSARQSFGRGVELSGRVYMAETTVADQIDRMCFELLRNGQHYLGTSARRAVRRTTLDETALRTACDAARVAMAELERQLRPGDRRHQAVASA